MHYIDETSNSFHEDVMEHRDVIKKSSQLTTICEITINIWGIK